MDTLGMLAFVLLGFGIGVYLRRRAARLQREKLANFKVPVFLPAVPGTLCTDKKEPHSWETLPVMDPFTGKSASKMICLDCGAIADDRNLQLSPDGLKKLKQQIEDMKELQLLQSETEEAAFRDFMKNHDTTLTTTELLRSAFFTGLDSSDKVRARAYEKFKEKRLSK